MKRQNLLLSAIFFAGAITVHAQSVSVNISGDEADASSILDVSSTTQGVLVPRMTEEERESIGLPAQGLLVYQTDAPEGFYYNEGTSAAPEWVHMEAGENVTTQGNNFNGASQLVQLDGSGRLPSVDGSQLTNIPSGGSSFLYSGWFSNSSTTSYKFPVVFGNVTPATTAPFEFTSVDLITFTPTTSGTIDNLLVKQVPGSSGSAQGNITVTLYKNDSPTALTCTFENVLTGLAQTTDYDPAHAVSVTPSDRLYFVAEQGGIGASTVFRLSSTVRFR